MADIRDLNLRAAVEGVGDRIAALMADNERLRSEDARNALVLLEEVRKSAALRLDLVHIVKTAKAVIDHVDSCKHCDVDHESLDDLRAAVKLWL